MAARAADGERGGAAARRRRHRLGRHDRPGDGASALGLAPFRGGIVQFADTVGVEEIVVDSMSWPSTARFAPTLRGWRKRRFASSRRRAADGASSRRGPPQRDAQLSPRRRSQLSSRSSRRRRAGKDEHMPTFKRADQEQIEKAKDLLEAAPRRELGFVKSLFFGRLKLDEVMPYPKQDAGRGRAHRRADREASTRSSRPKSMPTRSTPRSASRSTSSTASASSACSG